MIHIENYKSGKWVKDSTGYTYFLPNPIKFELA